MVRTRPPQHSPIVPLVYAAGFSSTHRPADDSRRNSWQCALRDENGGSGRAPPSHRSRDRSRPAHLEGFVLHNTADVQAAACTACVDMSGDGDLSLATGAPTRTRFGPVYRRTRLGWRSLSGFRYSATVGARGRPADPTPRWRRFKSRTRPRPSDEHTRNKERAVLRPRRATIMRWGTPIPILPRPIAGAVPGT